MNRKEVREFIDAAPLEAGERYAEYLAENPSCQAYLDTAMAFEKKIAAALEIPVPEISLPSLEADVVSLAERRQPRLVRSGALWFAAAASVVLALVLGVRLISTPIEANDAALVAELLEHMSHEPYAQVVTSESVPLARLAYVTRSAKTEVDPGLGLVSYARTCKINGNNIPHLVVQGEAGPVTILIMPDEQVSGTVPLESEAYHGVVVPVGESGSVAIIGRKGESIEDIRSRVGDAIKLSI